MGRGGCLEAGEVHDGLDEDGVVADVRVLGVELGERAEERAAAGDVHLAHRPLEGGGGDVGAKGVDDVLPVALVQQHQGHLEESRRPMRAGGGTQLLFDPKFKSFNLRKYDFLFWNINLSSIRKYYVRCYNTFTNYYTLS